MFEKIRANFTILLLTAGHGAVDLHVGLLAVVAPGISVYLGIPLGDIIFLVGIAALLNNLFQMIAGYALGRRNLAWTLWFSVMLSALPAFMGFAGGYYSLAALVILGAIGTGVFHPEAALSAHDASGEKSYLGIPLFMAGGACVYAFGTPISIAMAERFGFPSLALLALPGLAVAVTLLLQYRDRKRKHPSIVLRPRSKRITRVESGSMPFWPLLAVAICFGVANGLFISILSSHYELVFGPQARSWSGLVLMLFGVSASLCAFFWSSLAQKKGFYFVTILTQVVACPLFMLMAYPSSPAIGFLITIPMSIFSPSAVYPLAVNLARNAAGLTQGMRTSLTMGGTSGLSSLAVMVSGAFLRRGTPSSKIILFVSLCCFIAVLLSVWQYALGRKAAASR